jgi:hypothetical protein
MESISLLCSQCGITLRPFMKVCPKCGAVREEATDLTLPALSIPSTGTDPDPAPMQAMMQAPLPEAIYLSPPDTERRFPRFTSAQLTLIIIGILLIVVGIIIAWLLWRQQMREQQMFNLPSRTAAPPDTRPSASPIVPTSTPMEQSPDQLLEGAIKATLMAYNPFGFTRYRYEVKDGVVTLEGEADHQPEKDGAGNVLRLVSGVEKVVNRLTVRSEPGAATLRINDAEARVLEAALRRHLQEQEKAQTASLDSPEGPGSTSVTRPEAEQEAERLRRELALLRQRADDLARRQAIEERLRREAEEDLRRREAERLEESERARMAIPVRRELPILRAGSVAWSGVVDGAADILLTGNSADIRHLNGGYPTGVRASFSAPIPRSRVRLSLLSVQPGGQSRDEIRIIQSPAADNGYTAIVRIDDTRRGGSRRYEFTLRWELDDKQ